MIRLQQSSYKDPEGLIIETTDKYIIRKLSISYVPIFLEFYNSDLYRLLVQKKWLIPIELIEQNSNNFIVKTKKITPITYPYEWSYSQLKDAALLTLKIQNLSLKHGFSLKDSTAFNIIFDGCNPIFVDILSFELYQANSPWIAFEQFYRFFLLPLVIKATTNLNVQKDFISHIEGLDIPDYIKLLPLSSYFNYNILTLLILPYRVLNTKKKKLDTHRNLLKEDQFKMLHFLHSTISSLKQKKEVSRWNDYYSSTILENNYLDEKSKIVGHFIAQYSSSTNTAIDFGCNDGFFSRKLIDKFEKVISTDIDFDVLDKLYLSEKKQLNSKISIIHTFLNNPTPAIGLNNLERFSFIQRAQSDFGLALAITHHLRIYHNIPFEQQSHFFASIIKSELIIEFIDKSEIKIQTLLHNKPDVYPTYSLDEFKNSFSRDFSIIEVIKVPNFDRYIIKMNKIGTN